MKLAVQSCWSNFFPSFPTLRKLSKICQAFSTFICWYPSPSGIERSTESQGSKFLCAISKPVCRGWLAQVEDRLLRKIFAQGDRGSNLAEDLTFQSQSF